MISYDIAVLAVKVKRAAEAVESGGPWYSEFKILPAVDPRATFRDAAVIFRRITGKPALRRVCRLAAIACDKAEEWLGPWSSDAWDAAQDVLAVARPVAAGGLP